MFLRTEFDRRRARQADHAGLEGGIGDRVLGGIECGDGTQIDDRPAAATLHLRRRRLHRPHQSADAAREHAIDRLGVDLGERLKARPDGIVDQNRDRRAKLAFDAFEHRLYVLAPANVDAVATRFKAFVGEFRDRRLESPGADVDAREPRALLPKSLRDRKPDPARRAGDDAHAVVQARVHAGAFGATSPKALARSRNWNFCTLPAGVLGRSGTISTRSGQYCLATLFSAM